MQFGLVLFCWQNLLYKPVQDIMHSPKVKSRVIILVFYTVLSKYGFLPTPCSSSHSRKRAKLEDTSTALAFRNSGRHEDSSWAGEHAWVLPGCCTGLLGWQWGQISVPPACSPGKTDSSVQWVSLELLGLWKRAGMEEFVLFMLSPQLLSLQTLFLNKPSTRMEIGLESTTRLARGFELSKGIPPQRPVWWFSCTLLTHQRKLWKTHKNYYVSMAISRSSLTGRS